MEQILSVLFPCCFSRRGRGGHSQPADDEQTPLLRDRHGSSSTTSSAGAKLKATTSTGTEAAKSKHVSILPSPRYNAATLRLIVDDMKSKVIPIDTATAEQTRLPQPLPDLSSTTSTRAAEAEPAAAVHSLKLNIPAISPHPSTIASKTRLVDIWSTPAPTDISGFTTPSPSQPLTYSAAAKKAKAATKNSTKRKHSPQNKNPIPSTSSNSPSVEQKTFESLSETVLSHPLIHTWDIEDEHH